MPYSNRSFSALRQSFQGTTVIQRIFTSLFIFHAFAFCLAAAEQDTLEKMLPSISIFQKGTVELKHDKGKTKSVRYTGPQSLFFTISVFNPTCGEIADGAFSPELKQAFAKAIESKRKLHKGLLEGKTDTLTFECLAGKKLTGISTVLTYTDNNRLHHINLFMTAYRGNLLSIEFAPRIPLQETQQGKLFHLFLEQAKSNFYHGEKTNVPRITKDTIARAVRALEENPLETGSIAAQALRKFTDDSPDVFVMIQEKDFPWLPRTINGTPREKKYLNLLLASFMGGNIRAQLERDICQDMRDAGLASMKKTYLKLKEADPEFIVEGFEKKGNP